MYRSLALLPPQTKRSKLSHINMLTVKQNLVEIRNWIDTSPRPTDFKTDDDFMRFSVEIMRRCIYLLRLGTILIPHGKKEHRGYTKHGAIVLGHMVRITKAI